MSLREGGNHQRHFIGDSTLSFTSMCDPTAEAGRGESSSARGGFNPYPASPAQGAPPSQVPEVSPVFPRRDGHEIVGVGWSSLAGGGP